MKRLRPVLLSLCLLCSCAAPAWEPTPTPAAEITATPEPTPEPTPTPESTENPYAWLRDPAEIVEHVTIEGFYHRPFEELSQELRDSLTLEGETRSEQGYSFLLRTYTAPGIEIVTTEAPSEVLDEYLESTLSNWRESGENWEDYGKWTGCSSPEAFEEEVQGEKGREWLYSVTVSDGSYETKYGLKVGLTVEESEELGYPLKERNSFGTTWGNNIDVSVENGRVSQLHVWWGMGRHVGRYWDI